MAGKILVVEDELLMRSLLQRVLEAAGFTVSAVGTVRDALGEVGRQSFDLVLLDILLPDGDGFDCCKRMRARYHMPIVMISTKSGLTDRVTGLDTGADDYIVKPFAPEEVVARVKAQLRRVKDFAPDKEKVVHIGRLVVDPSIQDALIDGHPARLTQKEFRLLRLLAARAGRAVSREYLLDEVWGADELASDKSLAVYILRLRKKIEKSPDHPQILLTVRGFGYKIAAPQSAVAS